VNFETCTVNRPPINRSSPVLWFPPPLKYLAPITVPALLFDPLEEEYLLSLPFISKVFISYSLFPLCAPPPPSSFILLRNVRNIYFFIHFSDAVLVDFRTSCFAFVHPVFPLPPFPDASTLLVHFFSFTAPFQKLESLQYLLFADFSFLRVSSPLPL